MKKRVGLIVGSAVFCACRAVLAAQYVDVGFEDPCTHEENVAVVSGIVYDKFVEDSETYYGVLMETGTNRMWISATDSSHGARCLGTRGYAVSTGTKDRAEFRAVSWKDSYGLTFGQTRYYGYEMKIRSLSSAPNAGMHVMQVWQPGCGSRIPLTLSYAASATDGWVFSVDARTFRSEQRLATVTIPFDEWVRVVWKLEPSYHGFGGGSVKMWMNDALKVDWTG